MLGSFCHHFFVLIKLLPIVMIHKGDVVTGGKSQPLIAGVAGAVVFGVEDCFYTLVVGGVFFDDVGGAVALVIINNEYLKALISLVHHTIKALAQIPLNVIGG